MDADLNNMRHMFERYLYDYLVKRNMHQTAEIFSIEANLQLDPNYRPIDIPEGFLLEWWSFNYDYEFFRDWLQMHENQRSEATQGWNYFQEEQYPMNEEAMNEWPALNIESNSMPSFEEEIGEVPLLYFPDSYLEVCGGLSQLLLSPPFEEINGPSSHGMELLRPVIVANASHKEMEYSGQNIPQTENTALDDEEMDAFIENLLKTFRKFEQDHIELFDNSTVGESAAEM